MLRDSRETIKERLKNDPKFVDAFLDEMGKMQATIEQLEIEIQDIQESYDMHSDLEID